MNVSYTPPTYDPRTCTHPDIHLKYHDGMKRYFRPNAPGAPNGQSGMWCTRCTSMVLYVQDEVDFIHQRELKWTSENGLPAGASLPVLDMFGKEILIGSWVVYPRPGNTMGHGEVEALNHTNTITDHIRALRVRVTAPDRIKVHPDEWNSKRLCDYYNRRADGTPKSITLVEGACSAVVVR